MKSPSEIALFSLDAGADFLAQIARHLGVAPGRHEERHFEDGESKIRPLDNVRGRDIYLIQSLYSEAGESVNDKLVRLLIFIGGLRDAGAGRITALIPYLCYARKDRKTKARDPLATRYIAQLLEAVGTDRVCVLDVHNLAAYQNAFRCQTDHLTAQKLLIQHFLPELEKADICIASPDIGGVKRAELFRDALSRSLQRPIGFAFMEKQRSSGVVSGELVVGEVAGRIVLMVDDMIVSGGTLSRAATAFSKAGAQHVFAAASHAMFTESAAQALANSAIAKIAVTNSVPLHLPAGFPREKIAVVDIAPLLADAIRALHAGGSIVELLE